MLGKSAFAITRIKCKLVYLLAVFIKLCLDVVDLRIIKIIYYYKLEVYPLYSHFKMIL